MARKDMGKVKCLPTKYDLIGTGKCYHGTPADTVPITPMVYKYLDAGYYLVRYAVDFTNFSAWMKSASDGVCVRMGIWSADNTSYQNCKTSGLECEHKYIDYHSIKQADLHHSVSRHIKLDRSQYILCACTWGAVATNNTMGSNNVDLPYWVEIIRMDKGV